MTEVQNIIRDFRQKTADFIAAHRLLRRDAPVVVALSGGADSVALLAVLVDLGYDCRAAHCNFHLRGEESMRDMRHAASVCEALDTEMYVKHFDVAARCDATGESVEMACRELRYAWFDELLDRDCAQAIAVGHHREDRVETFMLNLFRGTGLAGLTAMRPRRDAVVRPLLDVSREEIEAFVGARGLGYVDDSSNASDRHLRNRVRNTLMPTIERLFPGGGDAVLRTIANLERAEAVYARALRHLGEAYFDGSRLHLAALAGDADGATLLFEHLKPYGFGYEAACDILAARGASGKSFYSPSRQTVVEVSRGEADIVDAASLRPAADVWRVELPRPVFRPVSITVDLRRVETFAPVRDPSTAYFDAEAFGGDAVWELRHPRRGDRMVPFGSVKSKLLSDIFTQAKLSAAEKRSQWVLTRNGEIYWLPGLRQSAQHAVAPGTKAYYVLRYQQ